jgi:hypothetical protein
MGTKSTNCGSHGLHCCRQQVGGEDMLETKLRYWIRSECLQGYCDTDLNGRLNKNTLPIHVCS